MRRFEDLAEHQPGHFSYYDGLIVIQRKGQVWMLADQVFGEHVRVPNVLEDGQVDLRIRLQPAVPRKLEVIQQRNGQDRRADGQSPSHWAGVLSSCCLAHIRFGFSSSDLANAWRAWAFWFCLRRASPSQR